MASLFWITSSRDRDYFGSVHICCVRVFILHDVSVVYCQRCRQGVMASFKTRFCTVPAYCQRTWIAAQQMVVLWLYAGDGLFEPLHRIVPVKCHCEWWSARVCCKGTSISMSCSTVNAKPFHSSEFSPLAPTLGHRVRTDNKWECYQTYPGKGNIDVWSCSGGGITNSFRCECAIFCAACLCLSALCQLTLKGKSLKVEPGKNK